MVCAPALPVANGPTDPENPPNKKAPLLLLFTTMTDPAPVPSPVWAPTLDAMGVGKMCFQVLANPSEKSQQRSSGA